MTIRLSAFLASDHEHVLNPDVDTPFSNTLDVVNRLLPYHIFYLPQEDLDELVNKQYSKGKRKASSADALVDIRGECFLHVSSSTS